MLTRSGGVLPSIEDELPVTKRPRTKNAATATAINTSGNELQAPAFPNNFPRQVQRKMGTTQRRPIAPRPVPPPSTARRVPRPRQEAVTITKTVVDQQYSIEIVKIALTATISTIAWARKILGQSEHYYDFRTIDVKSPDISYESFKNGQGQHPCIPRHADMQDLFIIKRGNHKAGDKLLDWLASLHSLEIGVADALEKGYLKGLQLNFSSPTKDLVEKYQIAIENSLVAGEQPGSLALSVNAETGSSQPSTKMTTDLANMNLIALASAIRKRMETTTHLPKGNIMTLDLWLNDKIPVGYNPLGFKISNNDFVLPAITSSLTLKTPYHLVTVHLPENASAAAFGDQIDNPSADGGPQIDDPVSNGGHQIDNKTADFDPLLEESQDNHENRSPVTVEEDPDLSRYGLNPLSNSYDSDEDVYTQADILERLETIGTRPHIEADRDTQRIESSQPAHVQTPKKRTMKQILRDRMMRFDSAAGSSTEGTPSPPASPSSVVGRKRSRENSATETTNCLSTQSPQVL